MWRIQHSQTREKLFNTNCQRKRPWHENHEKNNIHDHDNSELSESINFWYYWNDHSQHHFKNALTKIAQLRHKLKKENIHIWKMQLCNWFQVYVTTTIDDEWKINDIESITVFDRKN